jgi:hypothetical protein
VSRLSPDLWPKVWPERVTVGLFPGHCWLQRGAVLTQQSGSFIDAQQMLQTLDALLGGQERPLRKGARVQLLVSDSLAAAMPLAWQELLTSPDELRTYALAGFEQRGIALDEGWVVQTGFRHFRASGVAYALRQEWINRLVELLAARQLRLASVLPVSAAAYWRQRGGAGRRVTLLREPGRLTAVVGQGARLLDIDVQPVAGPIEQAATRLLKRVAVTHGVIQHISEWNAQAGSEASLAPEVSACFPDAAMARLPLHAWR